MATRVPLRTLLAGNGTFRAFYRGGSNEGDVVVTGRLLVKTFYNFDVKITYIGDAVVDGVRASSIDEEVILPHVSKWRLFARKIRTQPNGTTGRSLIVVFDDSKHALKRIQLSFRIEDGDDGKDHGKAFKECFIRTMAEYRAYVDAKAKAAGNAANRAA